MSEQEPILTNRQGHPVRDNQYTITVGNKGPATLENYNFGASGICVGVGR